MFANNFFEKLLWSNKKIVQVKFMVNNNVMRAEVPSDQLWISIKDILLNREYEFLTSFHLNRHNGLVVDAGGHIGLFTLVSSNFAKKIITIEPHPKNFELLKNNLKTNFLENVIAINAALWKNNQNVLLNENNKSSGHSIFSKSKKCLKVETITLQEIINDFGIIDLLKLDIEGSEFEVFSGINSNTLNSIHNIVGEIHLEYGNVNQIIDKLKENGFRVKIFYPPINVQKNIYPIKLKGFWRLKIFRKVLYFVSNILTYKTRNLAIIFASKNVQKTI